MAPGGDRGRLAWIRPPLPVPKAMKNAVRALRMRQNLAQGQLAEAMGVSRQTINSIENERYTPSLPLALALARHFGVTVEEMFDDQGS
jgi:putative transcriptional regulator